MKKNIYDEKNTIFSSLKWRHIFHQNKHKLQAMKNVHSIERQTIGSIRQQQRVKMQCVHLRILLMKVKRRVNDVKVIGWEGKKKEELSRHQVDCMGIVPCKYLYNNYVMRMSVSRQSKNFTVLLDDKPKVPISVHEEAT